ncbi:outer membrane beta-barrel family protein [Chryseobacterium muglaense]|uniref:TonB-dependent receptor family protein n=2 Tax=Chryseobacterium muglaense TaxID=2893752 RepID=A0ABR8MAB5_9FLAO|nr:outer membrane beta-barrel family protein [Chryseobacterium muglaense]MBD3907254.1 TonB-dependent receptor family protein [Chryseobacterium muglaense]
MTMYNKNKLSLSASFNYRDGGEYHDYRDYNSFPNEFWITRQAFKREYKRLNSVLGLQYAATANWTFGFQYIANTNNAKANRITKSSVYQYENSNPFNEILSEVNASQKPKFNSLNLFNEIKLDSLGKKINVNLDYFNYVNFDTRPYEGTSVRKIPFNIQYFNGINNNQQSTNNFSGKVDIELPTTWANWSTGGKISVSKTENYITAFNSGLVTTLNPDLPQINNQYHYDENVQALYVSGNKKINDQFEAQIGLRMEAIQTKSHSGNRNQSIDNKYTKLFPSINLSYSANKNSTYRFSYSKRIARPNFAELNPNLTYVTPFLSVEGNQVLRPYFVDNFEFFYTYKKLETKLYHSLENDVFNQVGLPYLETSNIRLIYKNIFDIRRYGISQTFTFDKLNWWNSINTLNINYSTAKTTDLMATVANGFTSFFTTNNDFNLNKPQTLLFNFSFDYYMFGNYGIDKIKPFTSTSLALQYLLLGKDLKITLKATDVFKTDRFRFTSIVNGVHRSSDYYFDTRMFQLAINYKFGSKKVNVKKRQTGNEDERARTGN